MNTWKPILAALVIFAAGVVTGGLTVKLRQPRLPHPGSGQVKKTAGLPREAQLRELSRRMQAELDLTHEQRGRIEAMIRESQERMKALRDDVGQKMNEELRELRQKIRGELTPEQRKKFAEIMKQHDDRTARPSPPAAGKPE